MLLRVVFLAFAAYCALVSAKNLRKDPPFFPDQLQAEIDQCYLLGSGSCITYSDDLYYDYENKLARVDYVYRVDMPDEVEGTFIFWWNVDPPVAWAIRYDDKKKRNYDCECYEQYLEGQMPHLRVPHDAVWVGQLEIEDEDVTVDRFQLNTTRWRIEYQVEYDDDKEYYLPYSTIQWGGPYGDFYCNFTDVRVKEPPEREFKLPKCCGNNYRKAGNVMAMAHELARPDGSLPPFFGHLRSKGNARHAAAPAKLTLGCLSPPGYYDQSGYKHVRTNFN